MDDYYYYAACIFIVATVSAFFSLIETRRNLQNLRDMAMYICDVTVFRNSKFKQTSSESLVPGDIVEIPSNFVLPCDMILLGGQCIVNESMLTGESIPIVKTPLPVSDDDVYHSDKDKKNTLYAGTKVIQTRAYGDEKVLGLVSRTAFSTAKGTLMLSILYPKPNHFKFYSDSFKFIGVLFLIAMCGFTFSLVGFIQMGVDWFHIMVRALDIVTVVVPPALPVAMTAGTVFAIQRLKKSGIYCISPPRVNVSGKLKLMCFDKTGTLTEEGLDFLGIRPVRRTNHLGDSETRISSDEFMDLVTDLHHVRDTPILHALATCHNLTYVDDELVGDPLDIKIFSATNWQLEEPRDVPSEAAIPTVVHPPGEHRQFYLTGLEKGEMPFELGIIRRFDFNSHLQRMSVIVKDLKHDKVYAFTKGSPEMIKYLSDPDTLPDNFADTLYAYAHQGYRVLACAYRELSGTPWLKLQRLKRNQVESNLRFLGLVVMQNKVKPETKPSLQTLANCNIRSVMVTGDNPFTALSVARECHLVHPSRKVFLGDVDDGQVTWTDIDSSRRLDPDSLYPYDDDVGEYELAITGKAFERLVKDHNPHNTPDPLFRKILVGAQIFSRMSPDQKTRLVEELQHLGYFVGMCGDGANDCGALKASHVGISLSEAEASIAAPFTSHNDNVSAVETVMREGRAALATSFSLFKYMALYSMIQFISVIILYRINSNLGNWQFLWIDMFVILPVAVLMGRTEARRTLVKKRPPGSLISIPVMTSLFGQILISLVFQVIVVLDVTSQPWFQPLDPDPHKDNIYCHLNTVVFLVSNFQYIDVALAFSISKPFRRSFITNKLYALCLLLLTASALYMIFIPDKYTRDIMQLDMDAMDAWYRLRIFGYVVLNLIVCWIFERVFVTGPGQRLCNNQWWKRRKRRKKLYRTLRSDFERSWSNMSLNSSDLP